MSEEMKDKEVYLVWLEEENCSCGVILDHFPTLDDFIKHTCMKISCKGDKVKVWLYCSMRILKVPLRKLINRNFKELDDYVIFSRYFDEMEISEFIKLLEELRKKCESEIA
ncbi:MAG: hypothetical protein DRI26_01060 [Chloroflexi bacterium]|nr:MAG: hypothetical protein DRI26_01060 [Chloroflexota bacterium]